MIARVILAITVSIFTCSSAFLCAMEHPKPSTHLLSTNLSGVNITILPNADMFSRLTIGQEHGDQLPPLIDDTDPITPLEKEELEQAFINAITNDNHIVAQLCLEKGVDPTTGALLMALETKLALLPLPWRQVQELSKAYSGNEKSGMPLGSLHLAAFFGATKTATLLLKYGVKVDEKAALAMQPLHEAASRGNDKIAELLIEWGAKVEAKAEFGMEPLHFASQSGRNNIIKILLAHGADINAKSDEEYTPLVYAIISGNVDSIELLASSESELNIPYGEFSYYPLHAAIANNASEEIRCAMVESLLKCGANVNAPTIHGELPIHFAAFDNCFEIAQLLVLNGADINALTNGGVSPIDVAQAKGYHRFVSWFENQTPQNKKLSQQSEQLAATLSEQKHHIDIINAIKNRNVTFIKQFLKENFLEPNKKISGLSFIHAAAMYGCVEVGQLLVRDRERIDHDASGVQPIHFAAMHGNLDFLKWLVSCGANIHAPATVRLHFSTVKFYKYWRALVEPIHFAANEGNLEVVKWFVENDVSILTPDENGNQPIHYAVLKGQNKLVVEERIELIKWLIANGASLDAKNKRGKRPIDYAKWFRQEQLVDWLKKNQKGCLVC